MRLWILVIVNLTGRLNRLIRYTGEKIERIACDAFGDTPEQYQEILALAEKKRRLIDLLFLGEAIRRRLPAARYFLLYRYAAGYSVAELGEAVGLKRQTAYKRLKTAFTEAQAVLESLNVTEETLVRDYADLTVVARRLRRLKKKVPGSSVPPAATLHLPPPSVTYHTHV